MILACQYSWPCVFPPWTRVESYHLLLLLLGYRKTDFHPVLTLHQSPSFFFLPCFLKEASYLLLDTPWKIKEVKKAPNQQLVSNWNLQSSNTWGLNWTLLTTPECTWKEVLSQWRIDETVTPVSTLITILLEIFRQRIQPSFTQVADGKGYELINVSCSILRELLDSSR